MQWMVEKTSVVRKIWGRSDMILFIFAGASAEFALNKAVDWLYFTGKLPADPLARLFSTVAYARKIVFASLDEANEAIDALRLIHTAVEQNRGSSIPDWAYRDVLFMLIHYSIVSYELLERKLSNEEKEDVFDVFYRVGARMGLQQLPATYAEWLSVRDAHLAQDLQKSIYTTDLFRQYKKHLGSFRFILLVEGQKLVVPSMVNDLLGFREHSVLTPVIALYKLSRFMKIDRFIRNLLLPSDYKKQINELDAYPGIG